MPEGMNLSVNGQSKIPPGFRFHPTEEELLQYYLKKKVSQEKIDLDVISEVDLNKLEPWDIQEKCKIGSTPQNDWYFFSHKDKKYPTGTRTNRATVAGFWKATGRDKVIYSNRKRIGMRKTLVFYVGRAPNGQKSDWIIHEYRLDVNTTTNNTNVGNNAMGETTQEGGWVVCRIFQKKNQQKSLESRIGSSTAASIRCQMPSSSNTEGSLEQILQYIGNTSKDKETNITTNQSGFDAINEDLITNNAIPTANQVGDLSNWEGLEQLVASHITSHTDNSRPITSFIDPTMAYNCNSSHDNDLQLPPLRSLSSTFNRQYHAPLDEIELWNFARSSSISSSDVICPASNAPV